MPLYIIGGFGVLVLALFVTWWVTEGDCETAVAAVREETGGQFTQLAGQVGRCDGLCVEWSPIGCTISDDKDSWFVSLAGKVKKIGAEAASGLETFTDSALGLTLEYDPADVAVAAGDVSDYPHSSYLVDALSSNSNPPPVRSSFILNEEPYEGTNFFGGWATLSSFSRLNDSDAELSCKVARYGTGTQELKDTKEINGVTWYYTTLGDAAAGTSFETRVYHAVHNGNCVELAATVAFGNMGNWDPGAIAEADEDEIVAKLEALVASAKF